MRGIWAAVASVLLITGAGCAPAPSFADWTIPVPAGTPIREHSVLPLEDRHADPVRLLEDLVLGAGPDVTFYGVPSVAVAEDGRIFVLDAGNHRVVVFSADGAVDSILGREGQGPGEFSIFGSQSIAVSADKLRVDDEGNNRLSIWDLEGNFLETRPSGPARIHFFSGLPDGRRIAFATERAEDGSEFEAIVIYDDDTAELDRLAQRRRAPGLASKRHDFAMSVRDPTLRYAVAPDGQMYVYDGAEYQVYAVRPSGEMAWALRTDYEPKPYPEEYKEWIVGLRRSIPRLSDLRVSDFDWPGRWPAVHSVHVDGHGHVYVIPLTFPYYGEDEYGADVFSANGDLLYSGSVTGADWFTGGSARGDFVYSIREQASGDHVVVRYRIEEPW